MTYSVILNIFSSNQQLFPRGIFLRYISIPSDHTVLSVIRPLICLKYHLLKVLCSDENVSELIPYLLVLSLKPPIDRCPRHTNKHPYYCWVLSKSPFSTASWFISLLVLISTNLKMLWGNGHLLSLSNKKT